MYEMQMRTQTQTQWSGRYNHIVATELLERNSMYYVRLIKGLPCGALRNVIGENIFVSKADAMLEYLNPERFSDEIIARTEWIELHGPDVYKTRMFWDE